MRLLAAFVVTFGLVVAGLAVPRAKAQQVAQVVTCGAVLDGGTSTSVVCGPIVTQLQPFSGSCEAVVPGSGGGSAGATVTLEVSPDGIHFGAPADAGLTFAVSQSGGGAGTPVTFDRSPGNPFQALELVATSTAQTDGGAGAIVCQLAVVPAQTLHLARPTLKAAKPAKR